MEGLKINIASFEDGNELKRAVLAVVQKSGFRLSDLTEDDNIDKVIGVAISVDGDKEVYSALWPCLARCTYKGEKITKATFEDPEMRQHYFPIVGKCIEENLTPFIAGLRSVWDMFRNPESQPESQK